MNDLNIIVIYTKKDSLTSLLCDSIIENSDNSKVFFIHQYDFQHNFYPFLDNRHISDWNGQEIWYWGSDNIFLYWYLSHPEHRAKQYLILEHDTYANTNIIDFLNIDKTFIENHEGIASPNIINYTTNKLFYWWFDCQKDNPIITEIYGQDNLSACRPLCGNVISDNAVQAIVKHIKEFNAVNKIYVETKFATILNKLNFKLTNLENPALQHSLDNYITFDAKICQSAMANSISNKAVFHPVKNKETLFKYKLNNLHNINYREINQALYGKLVDVKDIIESLHNQGLSRISVDNFLGADPVEGQHKKINIIYKKSGKIYSIEYAEGDEIDMDKL